MCGIAGCVSLDGRPVDVRLVERMVASLGHRGPDGTGVFDGGSAVLGHTRLALMDLTGGHQPMGNEAGDVMVAFNGEIYNFATLRNELMLLGHHFATRADTEIIPHAFEQWGGSAVERLRGMFAFALWEAKPQRLTLVRDRLGIKPLYYAVVDQLLLFSSEIKAILAVDRIEPRVDPVALHDYLSLLGPLAPQTLFSTVRALEPGTLLTVADGHLRMRRYWEPRWQNEDRIDVHQAEELLEERLQDVLRDQVVADVPVGAFLSGGIDSSLLVSFLAGSGRNALETFTVGFDERDYDESSFAQQVARRFATHHHELRIGRDAASAGIIRDVLDHFDQPFADSSAIPTWLIARETRKYVKTVVSGDGGDELFGGYTAYRVAQQLGQLRRLPLGLRHALVQCTRLVSDHDFARRLQKALAIAELSPAEVLAALRSYFNEADKWALYRPEQRARLGGYRTSERFVVEGEDLARSLALSDLRHRLAGDMLTKVDMMSMAHGLEVRVPLLDERIVDLALRLPTSLRLRHGQTKFLLRRVARRHLPARIAAKRKSGFVIPLRHAASSGMNRLIEETLGVDQPRIAEVFQPQILKSYLDGYRSAGRSLRHLSSYQLQQRLYALVALERWATRMHVVW